MAGTRATQIGVVGRGRLGSSLLAAAEQAGHQVAAEADGADLVFLTVPDSAIASACASRRWQPRQTVVHCSGALGLEVLGTAAEAGAAIGCFHPLQTFPSRTPEPARFQGIYCGIEGAGPAGKLLEQLSRELGAQPFRLEGVDRALYHASAVMVSNLLVALVSAATRVWASAGLPAESGREALSPLLVAAAANVASRELADALTGAVARGDLETVRKHLAALEDDDALREIYRRLSEELLRLPLGHSAAVGAQLREILTPRATGS